MFSGSAKWILHVFAWSCKDNTQSTKNSLHCRQVAYVNGLQFRQQALYK